MGRAVAAMDLPWDWAQLLYACAERGMEDSALNASATRYREGPAMTQQHYVNHGHPDGDIMASILAYHCFWATREHCRYYNSEWHTTALSGTLLGRGANCLFKGYKATLSKKKASYGGIRITVVIHPSRTIPLSAIAVTELRLNVFTDHAISIIGRDQLKPSSECLRGVATYPNGDMIQGRYAMPLSDLGTCFYDQAVAEGYG